MSIRRVKKKISGSQIGYNEAPANTSAYIESDSKTDTHCLQKSFIVLQATNRVAEIYPYDKSSRPKQDVHIVIGATTYDCETAVKTLILIFNESLFYRNKLITA